GLEYLLAGHHDPQIDDLERNEVTFRLPRVPANRIDVDLDTADQFGEIDRAEGIEQTNTAGGTRFSGILGSTDRCTIRWAPRTAPAMEMEQEPSIQSASSAAQIARRPEEPARLFAETLVLHSIGEGFVRSETRLHLNITRSSADQVTLLIPSGTEILDVRGDRLATHDIETGSETRLVCRFTSRLKSPVTLELTSETRMNDVTQLLSLPTTKVIGAERDQGYVGIEARTSIEIRKTDSLAELSRVTAVDVTDLPSELSGLANRPILLAFRYLEPPLEPPLQLDVVRHADVPVLNAVIDSLNGTTVLTSDGYSVTCLDMSLKNNGEQYLEARIPRGTEILSTALDGAPVTASSRGSDTCLIPIGTARTAASGKSGFAVRLVYKAPAPVSGLFYKLAAALPVLGLDIMKLEWRVYAPDRYNLIALHSNLEQPSHSLNVTPLKIISDIFRSLASPSGLMFCAIVLCIYLIWNRIKSFTDTPWVSWKSLGSFIMILFIILVLASVSGPMIGSITDQGPSAARRAMLSESIRDEGRASDEFEARDSRELQETDDYTSGKIVSKGSLDEEMRFDKKSKSAPSSMAAPSPLMPVPVKPSASPARRTSPGRDVGALPVDMQIPTSGNSVRVFRNHLSAGETAHFRGMIFWEPIRAGVLALLSVVGLLFALFLWLVAQRRKSWTAAIIVVLMILGAGLLDQFVVNIQNQAWDIFFFVLLILLIGRKAYSLRSDASVPTSSAVILVILGLLAGTAPVASAEPPVENPRVEQFLDLYVPYSQLGDRLPRDSGFVALSLDEYNYLRDIGIPDPDPARWYPPLGVTFVSASYTARVSKTRVDLKLRFDAVLLGKGFKQIEFPTDGVGVKSLTINGTPALLAPESQNSGPVQNAAARAVQQMQQIQTNDFAVSQTANQAFQMPQPGYQKRPAIMTDREGPVVIEAELVKDLTSRTQTNAAVDGFKLPVPVYGPANLDLLIDRPKQMVDIQPAVITQSDETDNSTHVTAILQPSPMISVEWRDKAATVQVPQLQASATVTPPTPGIARIAADHEVLFSVSEGVISMNDLVRLQIDQHPAGDFLFDIPSGTDVLEVNGSDIASWICLPAGNAQELRVQLNARRMNQVELRISMERQTPAINGKFPLDL
ncbi:MAG TPA: hypothetical protein PKM25_08300, partial [Candidatus Ozemobacteraceae bacterium]|nr:hypothetical protein [Candidatus Ozemobacteraceae bacterium]